MKDGQTIERLTLEDIMSERFSRYSKSIIQERALPDVRDGLKPVQRRILYAMNKDGNTYNKGFRKAAKSVGNVMGNFHPHGDSSIYEAMVRMSQDWKLKEPLIEMHGNNGSMDGDPAAAMRYTEARLSKIAGEMLRDIDKDTVEWVLNFDDTEYEPVVLPSRFPNLLVNGATGISAGYATEIPSHNLGEVIDAVIALQKKPSATLEDLMQYVKGPDFPTGGIIQGIDEIKRAYETGRGRIAVRSKTKLENLRGNKKLIRVTEIPYEVNKLQLVKQMDEIRIAKKIDGIAEVRDESDRNGLSIAIELKRDVDAKGILNYLFKNTDLQISYNFNMVAIDNMRPERLSLKHALSSYLEFQRLVVKKRTQFDLEKALARQEIVQGLIKALSILDDVIKAIRESTNKASARDNLVTQFDFTKAQADSIVNLQLYRLTNTDVTQLNTESEKLKKEITSYQTILADSKQLDRVLRNELRAIKKAYATPRQSVIEEKIENLKISTKVTVPDEDVIVLVSDDGYLKRSSIRSYRASEVDENGLKSDDHPIFMRKLNTRDHLMMFTNKGHLIYRPVFEITDTRWKDTGEHISQTIGLDHDEKIIKTFAFNDLKATGSYLISTSDGYVKLTEFNKLLPGRTYKSHASVYEKLKHQDATVLNVEYVEGNTTGYQLVVASQQGMATRYDLSEVSFSGAKSTGVRSIDLKDDDQVTNCQIAKEADLMAIITQRGAYKNLPVNEIPKASRGRRGVIILKALKANPHMIASFATISEANLSQPLRIYTDHRRMHDVIPADHPISERYANGSFIIDVKSEGQPISIQKPLN
ncbi:DNA topoisomerase IV subunit A [Lactobacillaceae bacterium Scapto_B20]